MSTEIELSPAGVQPEGKTPEHSDALRALRRIITELDAERASLVEAADLDKLAIGLSAIRTLIGDLRMLADATEANVVELMPQRRYEIEGLGTLERPTLDPDGTGELPDLPTTVASLTSLTQEVIGLTPSKQPRVTALRAMGVDPDDWCEVSPGRTSVQIHGAAK